MKLPVYFDNHATTPLDPRVLEKLVGQADAPLLVAERVMRAGGNQTYHVASPVLANRNVVGAVQHLPHRGCGQRHQTVLWIGQHVKLLRASRYGPPFCRYRHPLLLVHRVPKRADENRPCQCSYHGSRGSSLKTTIPHNAPHSATTMETCQYLFANNPIISAMPPVGIYVISSQ